MAFTQKLKNFFVFRRDKTQEVLKSGEAYQLTRQGGVITSADNATPAVDPVTGQYNTNVLEVLGSRGDPRQLEALYRNMTNLYTNGATQNDYRYSGAVGGDRTVFVTVPLTKGVVYDAGPNGGFVSRFDFWNTPDRDGATAELKASDNGTVWVTYYRIGHGYGALESGGGLTRKEDRYRYFKLDGGTENVTHAEITVSQTDTSRFLRREEQDKLKKKVADPYNIHLFIEGGLKANDTLLTFVAPRDLELPKGMEGTVLHCEQWPAYAYTLVFAIDSVVAGTIQIQPSGATILSASQAVTIPKGAKLRLYTTQVADPQLADLAITLSLKRLT